MKKPTRKYTDLGNIEATEADYANIPVDIWLTKVDAESRRERPKFRAWLLTANNYMPRRGALSGENAYCVTADSRTVLVQIVKKYWLPIYQKAVARLLTFDMLDKNAEKGTSSLYYWRIEGGNDEETT